ARLPSRRASAGRGTDRAGWQAATGQQPRNHRIGVPHLARPQLLPAPHRAGQAADQVEEATRPERVVAQGLGACDRLVGVGDDPVPPPAYLVAKYTEARHPAAGDGALDDHAARRTIGIRDRPAVLDDEA